jgi:hypothetical protein
VALVEPWWSLGGALVWLWCGFGVALGWLCTPESMPSIWLWCGFGVALGGLPPFLVQGSRFEVQRSTFSLRPEHQTQESRLPPIRRKPDLYYEAWRRLEWPKVLPRESPMTARRLSHDSPVCLPGSDNRFRLCNWGPEACPQSGHFGAPPAEPLRRVRSYRQSSGLFVPAPPWRRT